MDSLRGTFMVAIGNGTVTLANVTSYEDELVSAMKKIYVKFKAIEKRYPSSVEEFRNYRPFISAVCDSACNNIDFETGNLSGWNAFYAVNTSSTTARAVSIITGGPAGPVIHAANDTLTSTTGYYNTTVGKNPRPDYQINVTSGSRGDAIVPSVPVVSPFGGHYSVMLGDSTQVNYGVAILSQTFLVGSGNANLTYQYAVFLENPSHNFFQQPFFTVKILNSSGDTIAYCGEYNVVSGNGTQTFDSIQYYDANLNETLPVYYKNWTIVNVPLVKYIGQCITVVFEAGDCGLGGHFGYAYVDASCSPLNVVTSSQNFCGQDSITLTGPAGEGHYYWTGPSGGIMTADSLQQISVDSAGTYTLVVTPFTGASCKDTLHISIGKVSGPPPHPNFKADTGCVGLSTSFFNMSNPISGAKFYWDFYNNGTYEDSTVNPTWSYNLPGTYTVKLEEIYNGCGTDTTIKVVIDPVVGSSFLFDTVCFGDTTRFTNTSTGAVTNYWNFGNSSSGVNNTSVLTNPGHYFTAPGTYTVALIGKHADWCNDTAKEQVVVLALPVAKITGTDSICSGGSSVLTASGGSSFVWNTGATTSTITVSPTTDTTFTVSVSNGKCSVDTTYKIVVKPLSSGTLSGTNVCFGDTIKLSATGGGSYLWNTGATTSSISVPATSFNDTAYSVTIVNSGSCITLNKDIIIYPIPTGYVCCDTTIFNGTSVILHGSGGTSYYWTPPFGVNCDTCPNPTVTPTVTTTYTLTTISANGCSAESDVTITVDIPCKDLIIPNVFTPNGDGVNNTFLIKVEFMSSYDITIYNRWGRMVFTSTNPDNPWDGNIGGSPASTGVYYYIIRATCFNGNSIKQDGFLQLIR
ncbi:MAG TPA: gliding motility-associated C-terminal domain-containing protein [Bacteroidia bacterium]|nr:gliding motility-associated C-terminal domain-containing protein [Bacteroidia bacterium]